MSFAKFTMRTKNNSLSPRKLLVMGVFVAVGIVFILKLFSLQVVDKSYVALADNNALRYVTQYPRQARFSTATASCWCSTRPSTT